MLPVLRTLLRSELMSELKYLTGVDYIDPFRGQTVGKVDKVADPGHDDPVFSEVGMDAKMK